MAEGALQTGEKNHWQLHFHRSDKTENLVWKPPFDEVPVLALFDLSIKKLQDHQAYLNFQVKYLNGLQDRWRLFNSLLLKRGLKKWLKNKIVKLDDLSDACKLVF